MNGSHYESFTEKVPGWDILEEQLGGSSTGMTEKGNNERVFTEMGDAYGEVEEDGVEFDSDMRKLRNP